MVLFVNHSTLKVATIGDKECLSTQEVPRAQTAHLEQEIMRDFKVTLNYGKSRDFFVSFNRSEKQKNREPKQMRESRSFYFRTA